ncbi:MAG: hypothetical protein V1794_12120, partial [Candidatus Glassbacteria bacterium]
TVAFSYPARHFTTLSGTWGYQPEKTSDYAFGADALYERDAYGADYMEGMAPWPAAPADCNALFERFGKLLREAFSFAHRLGVRTCVGTETPLVVPEVLAARLKKRGLDPADSTVALHLYEGIFRRIMENYPLDYYWFWTPEDWTWQGATPGQVKATLADLAAARAAAENVKAPFTLATCGWVLGPQSDRALFDKELPKEMPLSCINREVGMEPVEPGFASVNGRPKWAIPWLEDDPALIIPQLWAGRMRRDAADALAYGCTGLFGIHWRTRILGPNVSALAQAAWDQTGWNSGGSGANADSAAEARPRDLPSADFYADWALQQFGPEVAEPAARIFTSLDGRLPRPSTWVGGPGGLAPDSLSWEETQEKYAFVDDLAGLRAEVRGAGNLERFDYWLNSFRYLRAVARINYTRRNFTLALEKAKTGRDAVEKKRLARELALPMRIELTAAVTQAQAWLMASVSTTGSLGTIANWQQHLVPDLLTRPGEELAGLLGEPLPEAALPPREYGGPPRLIVPVARTSVSTGEILKLKAIFIGGSPETAVIRWRPLGQGSFAEIPLERLGRGVYTAGLGPDATSDDLEYYIQALTAAGDTLRFPATAPLLNQTVVVLPEGEE